MKNFSTDIQTILIKISNCVKWFFGDYDGLFYAILAFAIIDYITNIMRGILERPPTSCCNIEFFSKKLLIFIFIGIGNILDTHVFGSESVIRAVIILFYLSHEGVSIINNASCIGLPVPKKLKSILEQLQNKNEQ